MKKRLIFYSVLYYLLVPAVFYGLLLLFSAALTVSRERVDLGALTLAAYAFSFFALPVTDAVMMRFSPLNFIVDPFAALEIPLFMYLLMVFQQFKTNLGLREAFLVVNNKLADDHGMGFLFLIALFIFGVLFSISLSRRRGQSIAYRIINRSKKTG